MSVFQLRRERLAAAFRELSAEAVLVSHEVNVSYLTGFTGDSSYLLMTPQRTLMISDSRYQTQLQDECPDIEVLIRPTTVKMVEAVGTESTGIGRLAIEADHLTLAAFEGLKEAMPSVELLSTTELLDRLREVKDDSELAAIRASVKLAEQSMLALHQVLKADMTELEAAAELEHLIRQRGGTGCSFSPIIAVGSNAALPHARPSSRRLSEHGVLLTDWGALLEHYMSDLTRVWMTDKITTEIEAVYGVVLTAQERAIARIHPGATTAEVDEAARSTISDAGYGEYFGHGLGHGFGLEIHEQPRLSPAGGSLPPRALQPGMVVTVEPGIYLPGNFGVRIEDDVLVTEDGHEVLSTITKQLDACRLPLA